MGAVLEASYKNLLKTMSLINDPSQLKLVRLLQNYQHKLLFSKSDTFTEKIKEFFNKNQSCPIKMGVYIWGDVGRGKSMIMDFFFNHTPNIPKKR
ncbi:MAG: AFG1/ZapE family ATPase [Candidatus Midichloria sp.]|nr:AFG1/ZapE family ATPase [Candidatus Midichloria sp.]